MYSRSVVSAMVLGRTRVNVVIDGSNVIAGGSKSGDSDGHRLISAIELYEKKGYTVLPRMKNSTYWWMKKNDGKASRGFEVIDRLVREKKKLGIDILIEDDDLYIINLALEKNAWLVTNDTFESYYNRDGEEVKRERANHPDIEWSELDQYTWGTGPDREGRVRTNEDWRVDGPNFLHPRLPQAPGMNIKDDNSKLRVLLTDLGKILGEIEIFAENHPDQDSDHINHIKMEIGHHRDRHKRMIDIIPEPDIPSSRDELSSMTVEVLKEYCSHLGIKKSGLKSEIIGRIIEQTSNIDHNEIDDENEAPTENMDQILETLGFSKYQFVSALMSFKKSKGKRQSFASTYCDLIDKYPRYNLKNHGIKANSFLEECGDIIDYEIREKDGSKHYWI